MTCIENVVLALAELRKSRDPVFLPQRGKRFLTPRQDLVRIGLVPDVEHQFVVRAVEYIMHRDNQIDRAEA